LLIAFMGDTIGDMMTKRLLILLTLGAVALAACSFETKGDKTDPEAAQSFIPTLPGYNIQETDHLQDAIASAAGGASLLTGNIVQAALVQRIDALIDCYRNTGAVDARIYVERLDTLNEVRVPIGGALAVINQDRVRDNFLGCVTQGPAGLFGAQSAQAEPCYGSGTFQFNGDTISYIYGATDRPLCDLFDAYFAQYQPSG
jgi:hypothetical protein